MSTITLLHGSTQILKSPCLSLGKETNDYGKGLYCTKSIDMAKEWACKNDNDGYVNKYALDTTGLKVLDLTDKKYNVLNWVAILLKHRIFTINDEIALQAKKYILDNYLIDTSTYDIIIGYRADDSYFSFARSFITNAIPIRVLSKALKLGLLGEQTVLVSEKAFSQLTYIDSEIVNKNIYYPKFIARDLKARNDYKDILKTMFKLKDDLFILDIMRGDIKNNDPRLQ